MEKKSQSILMAIESLVADGVADPTNQQVRERLGSGSYSDITPVLKAYKEGREKTKSAALMMPSALREQVEASLNQVWRVASELSSDRLLALEEKHSTERKSWERERKDLLNCIRDLEDQEGRLIKTLTEIKAERTELANKSDGQYEEISELRLKNQKLMFQLNQALDRIRAEGGVLNNDAKAPVIILPHTVK